MVATSVCARGLDIKSLVLVINFSCPNHLEDYIHRIGRTGRAGNKGTAITFISPEDEAYVADIIKALEIANINVPNELREIHDNFKNKVLFFVLRLPLTAFLLLPNENHYNQGCQFYPPIILFLNILTIFVSDEGLSNFIFLFI